jgi:hypothetical protein
MRFYDLKTSRVLDSVGGMGLARGICVRSGILANVFARMRSGCFRPFASRRGSAHFDPATAEAVKANAGDFACEQRKNKEELTLMLCGPSFRRVQSAASRLGLLCLPEIEAMRVEQPSGFHRGAFGFTRF